VTPRNRKGEATGNTNFDLNRRASLRPYLGAPGGEIPPGDSPEATVGSNAVPQLWFDRFLVEIIAATS
jgi:hypothetical protein